MGAFTRVELNRTTLAFFGRWICLAIGWGLAADGIARMILYPSMPLALWRLALAAPLLWMASPLLPAEGLVAGVLLWCALYGIGRIGYFALHAVADGTAHPFTAFGYCWRAMLFLAIGAMFRMISQRYREERAA
jgi:hypothetical protein